MFRFRFLILNGILLLTLLSSYWGRRMENIPVSQTDFLKGLELPFHGCQTTDVDISADERSMLQPDAVLIRRYSSARGWEAELAVIAGHQKRSVHDPGFCMVGGGWDTLWQKSGEIALTDRTIPAMQEMVAKDGVAKDGYTKVQSRMIVTYFFTNGDYCTRNLLQFQGAQFLNRLRSQLPEGALVRIIVPIRQDEATAKAIADEFAQAVLPATLEKLRQTHLQFQ